MRSSLKNALMLAMTALSSIGTPAQAQMGLGGWMERMRGGGRPPED